MKLSTERFVHPQISVHFPFVFLAMSGLYAIGCNVTWMVLKKVFGLTGDGQLTPLNKVIVSARPRKCPACASSEVFMHGRYNRIIYDLKFSLSGVKWWVVEYRNHRFICQICKKTFYPSEHPETRERFGNGLVAWIVYQNIGLRQSQENVGKGLNDIFGFHFNWRSVIPLLKRRAVRTYRDTYEEILYGIQRGHLVHVDETNVSVKGTTAYVWVFTNLDEVAYVYSPTREGTILEETLRGFHGVLVSDFSRSTRVLNANSNAVLCISYVILTTIFSKTSLTWNTRHLYRDLVSS